MAEIRTPFDHPEFDGHEGVLFERHGDLTAIVAVHSTRLGPALGGTRWWDYPTPGDALTDVLRLSWAMSYKAAMADLPLGGGKAVIVGPPAAGEARARLLAAYARVVDGMGGRYLTAADVGTAQPDIDAIRAHTPYVAGTSAGSGDPSPSTAAGVLHALRAAHVWMGRDSLQGADVAVSGLGKVGAALVALLAAEGVHLTVSDIDGDKVARVVAAHGARVVAPDEIHRVRADIFAPCALGGVLDATTIPELRCAAVVGAANNQLADAAAGTLLAERGIVYVPDYVANAGGLIHVAQEPLGWHADKAGQAIDGIGATVRMVLDAAAADGVPTSEAADRMARERIGR